MTLASTKRVQKFRARQTAEGNSEVRGVFLPKHLHKALKTHAQWLLVKDKIKES